MRIPRGQGSNPHPAPHSQDSLLNWQRCVQPTVYVAAVGLVQPEHQCAALGGALRLQREVGGGQGQGRWAGPRVDPTPPLACLTVSSTTAGEDTEKALQVAMGTWPGVGSANSGKLRL